MTPVPAEASNGATAAAVAQQHRDARTARRREQDRKATASMNAAVEWVRRRPELCWPDGRPDIHAVVGAVWLRDQFNPADKDHYARLVDEFRRSRVRRSVEWGLMSQADADLLLGAGDGR